MATGHPTANDRLCLDRLNGTDGELQIDIINADGSERKRSCRTRRSRNRRAGRRTANGRLGQHADGNPGHLYHRSDGKDVKRLTNDPRPTTTELVAGRKRLAFCSGRTGRLTFTV